jgi:hypothetical protein
MICQWRYLKLLKRSVQGHDPAGARATKPGECAVLCPACPQPGKNLIPGWQDAPDDKQYTLIIVSVTGSNISSHRWLYALFLGIGANFCLKHKKISSDKADPDLNHGCAYFVEE